MLLVVVFGALVVSATVAPKADAYTPQYWTTPANKPSIANYLAQPPVGKPAIPGIDLNDARATAWWQAEHQPYPGSPSSADMHDDLRAARARTGILPKLATFAKFTLPTAAFTLAIEYGPGLFEEIGLLPGAPAGATGTYVPRKVSMVDKGEIIASSGLAVIRAPQPMRVFEFGTTVSGATEIIHRDGPVAMPPAPNMNVCRSPGFFTLPSTSDNWGSPDFLYGLAAPARGVWGADIPVGSEPPMFGPTDSYCPSGTYRRVGGQRKGSQMLSTKPPDATTVAPPTWTRPSSSSSIQSQLDAIAADFPELSQYFDHLVRPDEVDNPYVHTTTIPSCTALTWAECAADLEEADLVPIREKLGWQHAHVDKPHGAVISLDPEGGSEVDQGTSVTVVTNPEQAEMPLVIPNISTDPNEHHSTYTAALEDAGFPALGRTTITASDANSDTAKGPGAVISVRPAEGSRHNPSNPPATTIVVNPPDMPIIGGSGGCTTPDIRGFDLSPLNQPYGDTFPFAIFSWVGDWLNDVAYASDAPSWSFTLGPFEGSPVLDLDLATMDPVIDTLRPVILAVSAIGTVWMFAALAFGFGRGQDD